MSRTRDERRRRLVHGRRRGQPSMASFPTRTYNPYMGSLPMTQYGQGPEWPFFLYGQQPLAMPASPPPAAPPPAPAAAPPTGPTSLWEGPGGGGADVMGGGLGALGGISDPYPVETGPTVAQALAAIGALE